MNAVIAYFGGATRLRRVSAARFPVAHVALHATGAGALNTVCPDCVQALPPEFHDVKTAEDCTSGALAPLKKLTPAITMGVFLFLADADMNKLLPVAVVNVPCKPIRRQAVHVSPKTLYARLLRLPRPLLKMF